ncbi:MAG: flagellar filament capping protein FliD [Dehalococcoidia bacterium]
MVSSSSSSTSSGGIWFGGFASGLDTASIVDALTAARRRPIDLALARVAEMTNKQKALQQINSSLANLLSSLDPLRQATTVSARRASLVNADDSLKLGVSASSSAAIQSFTVDIDKLASATKVNGTAAIGQAVSQVLAMDEAGFANVPTAGTFTINGTKFTIPEPTFTTMVSSGAVGAGVVDPSVTLDLAGLTLPPDPTGSFDINGISISYDVSTDSLNTIITRINTSSAGVTASFDEGTNQLTLTRNDDGPTAITVSDTSGNFLETMNIVDNVGTTIGTETLGTDLMTLGDVVSMINGAAIGVTATMVNDVDGRPNLLNLTSGSTITLGSGGDTSNFLAATNLLQSPGTTSRTSVRNIGTLDASETLDTARLQTAIAPGSGTFEVNGVEITYDTSVDSLNSIISRINASAANVTATYDGGTDTLLITSDSTGSVGISLADTSGNFLAAMNVLAAPQTLGSNAEYRINGGATQYATTNDVANALPGVSLTLKQTTTSAITVNVAADTNSVRTKVQAFVDQFNSTMGLISDSTKYVEGGQSGSLIGDVTLRGIQNTMRSMITSVVPGNNSSYNSLSSIGLSFGKVGSAVGEANTLTVDSARLDAAITSNPEAVARLLTAFKASAALDPSSSGSLAGISGAPTVAGDSGKYTLTTAASGSLTLTFTPDNGGSQIITTHTISPGEVNTTLIPGMTLTFQNPLVDGTDTIVVSATEEGVGKSLYEYLENYTRSGGIMDGRDDEMQSRIDDINEQVDKMEDRLDAYRQSLITKYARLEVTMQSLQNQQAALQNYVNQLNANKNNK